MSEQIIISKQRVKDFGEVFTPKQLVKDMCNLVQDFCYDEEKTFFEPACGNGNFLVEILNRKLLSVAEDNDEPTIMLGRMYVALGSLFGCDIQEDNIVSCKERLSKMFYTYTKGNDLVADRNLVTLILDSNIKCANSLTDTVAFCSVKFDEVKSEITLEYFATDLNLGTFSPIVKTAFNI